jgi:hypothetical protein
MPEFRPGVALNYWRAVNNPSIIPLTSPFLRQVPQVYDFRKKGPGIWPEQRCIGDEILLM